MGRNLDLVTGTIFTDSDLDGVAGAAMWKRHSDRPAVISRTKLVHSQPGDLIIDVGTDGEGFVVDHHCRHVAPKNPLRYEISGFPCSARLVYELLEQDGVVDRGDLILSAIAEITEGLHDVARGSVGALFAQEAATFRHLIELPTQRGPGPSFFLFVLADAFGVVTESNPEEALRLSLEVAPTLATWDQFRDALKPEFRELVDRYFRYMALFCSPSGRARSLAGLRFLELNISSGEMEFAPQILTRVERMLNGANIFAFRGQCVSLRTKSREAVEWLYHRLGNLADSWGGRCNRWGIHLVRPVTFQEHEALFF